MTKQLIPRYTFSASAKTVTFSEFDQIDLERVLLITNVTDNIVVYSFADPLKGGTVATNVLTLDYSTTMMSDTDRLAVFYDTKSGDPQYNREIVGNARSKFRDGFDSAVQPNPAVWDLAQDSAHLITAGGNAFGSSYLRISMDPFTDSSEVVLTSKETFQFPMRLGFGISMSQRSTGQEVFIGLVGADDAGTVETLTPEVDHAITGATVTIATNVGTVTMTGHPFNGGDRVVVFGCAEHRLNVGPVVVTVVDKNHFTLPITLADGASYSTTGGYVRHADPFRLAKNGAGLLFESVTATTASFAARRSGGKYRSVAGTVSTTVATQGNVSPYTDAFNSAATHEFYASMEEIYYRSFAADGVAATTGALKYSQAVPDEGKDYKLRIRARNLGNMTKPVARISAIAKTGTTTATVTTDVATTLAVGDMVQVYGVRDATSFPNLTAMTAVASVIDSTHFTVIDGTALTVSSAGGVVFRVEGSVLAATTPGVFGVVAQSISRTSNVLTVIGNGTWATPLPGEFMHLYGLEPAALAYEGAYKVLRVSTSSLELESIGADFGSITTGGVLIRRTDVRVHFARVMDYTRHVVEVVGGRGNANDANNAVPVTITGSTIISASQQAGLSSTMWSAGGWGGFLVADIASAAIGTTATSAATSPGSVANVGTNAHSFSVIVTAASGTNPTMDVSIEESPDNGTNWVRIYDFPRIVGTGTYVSPILPAVWGSRYRYVRTIGGTATPSFTMSLNRLQHSVSVPLLRSFVDRSIVLTTLNSVTPSWFVERADTFNLTVTIGTVATAPILQIEGSEDNGNWYAIGGALTAVASSTVMLNVSAAALPKWVRVRASTAAVTLAAGPIVTLKAIEN